MPVIYKEKSTNNGRNYVLELRFLDFAQLRFLDFARNEQARISPLASLGKDFSMRSLRSLSRKMDVAL